MKFIWFLASSYLVSVCAAHATVRVTIEEVGSDVVVSHTGTIDLAAATSSSPLTSAIQSGVYGPTYPLIVSGGLGNVDANQYDVDITAFPDSMIAGVGFSNADSGTGGLFGISQQDGSIYLPNGYVSGATITGTSTFNETTIADIGLTEGAFKATFSNGSNTENILYTVGVPESSQFALILSLMTLGACLSRRRF